MVGQISPSGTNSYFKKIGKWLPFRGQLRPMYGQIKQNLVLIGSIDIIGSETTLLIGAVWGQNYVKQTSELN